MNSWLLPGNINSMVHLDMYMDAFISKQQFHKVIQWSIHTELHLFYQNIFFSVIINDLYFRKFIYLYFTSGEIAYILYAEEITVAIPVITGIGVILESINSYGSGELAAMGRAI